MARPSWKTRSVGRGEAGILPPFLLVLTVLALLALAPASALAGIVRPYEGFIAPSDTPDTPTPGKIAVDQDTGDVYVVESNGSGIAVVSRYTAAGAPDNFTAGPDAGTNTLTGLSVDPPRVMLAIDNSGGPLNGHLYVTQAKLGLVSSTIQVYAQTGAMLGTITGAGAGALNGNFGNSLCGTAVDQSTGALYVTEDSKSRIFRLTPTSPAGPIDDADYSLTGITLDGNNIKYCELAADSGNVYVSSSVGGKTTLERYSASSFSTEFTNVPSHTTVGAGDADLTGLTGVSVDPGTGDVYVDEGGRVAVFNQAGTFLYRFGFAAHLGMEAKSIAVRKAPSGAASKVYVSTLWQEGRVAVFGAPERAKVFTNPELDSFGASGVSNTTFASGPNQLALDQASASLYAVQPNPPGIRGFDISSPPGYSLLEGFDPLPTDPSGDESLVNVGAAGIAVDNSSESSAGNVYLASRETNLIYGWSAAGTPLGGAFPLNPALSPGGPAGSPSKPCGVAVDSAGRLWVANAATNRILEYSSAGASLPGTIDTSAQGSPCHIAFDSADNLYVLITGTGTGTNTGIWKYSAVSGYSSATAVGEGRPVAIAVDPSNDHLFAAFKEGAKSWVDMYDPAGKLVNELTTNLEWVAGIAVDASTEDIYVSNRVAGKIQRFGPAILLPEATARPTTGATNTSAVLHASVGSQEVALDDCHFEFVSEAAFGLTGFSDLSSGGSLPCEPGFASVPLDLEEHDVSATASGLTKNTPYRFRIVVSNADGDASDEASFSSAGQPLVETTGSPVRTATTAQLQGRVDPSREDTDYHFEFGTEGPCDANPCQATDPRAAGSGNAFELVAQSVEGLQPDTTYHYRLIADNGNSEGPAVGADMTLTTRASDAPLTHGRFPGPPGSDRAWEQVSIADSGGNPVVEALGVSDNGDRAFFRVAGGTPISSTGTYYNPLYAERTSSGWRSENIFPKREQLVATSWLQPAGRADLSDQVVINFNNTTGAQTVWRIRPGQPASLVFQPQAIELEGPILVSEDASRVLIRRKGSLDPAHPVVGNGRNLYDITSGTPQLVDLMPDGSVPACGTGTDGASAIFSLPGSGPSNTPREAHWLSPDGAYGLFPSRGDSCSARPQLYLREFDAAQTKLVSGPALSGATCGAAFIKSTPKGVFFWTQTRLSPEDTDPGGCAEGGSAIDGDVYLYDTAAGSLECVTCVIPDTDADVYPGTGSFIAQAISVAADGSRVYFSSPDALLAGSKPGLYEVDVANGDLEYVSDGVGSVLAVTPDGSALAFSSNKPSLNPIGGLQNGGTVQYYRYDARDRSLVCLSCPQDGSVPKVATSLVDAVNPGEAGGAAGANKTNLSADGQTFAFSTSLPLVAADQNTARAGQVPETGMDVYEWRDGRLLLLSDGLTSWPETEGPRVGAMSPSGRDVFILAATQYTPDALDGYRRLYDARIGGGFEFPVPPKPCPLEVCQGTPKGAPEEQQPGSGNFSGSGSKVAPPTARRSCPKGRHKARKGGKTRCVKTRGKGKAQQKQRQRAKHDRRAAR